MKIDFVSQNAKDVHSSMTATPLANLISLLVDIRYTLDIKEKLLVSTSTGDARVAATDCSFDKMQKVIRSKWTAFSYLDHRVQPSLK